MFHSQAFLHTGTFQQPPTRPCRPSPGTGLCRRCRSLPARLGIWGRLPRSRRPPWRPSGEELEPLAPAKPPQQTSRHSRRCRVQQWWVRSACAADLHEALAVRASTVGSSTACRLCQPATRICRAQQLLLQLLFRLAVVLRCPRCLSEHPLSRPGTATVASSPGTPGGGRRRPSWQRRPWPQGSPSSWMLATSRRVRAHRVAALASVTPAPPPEAHRHLVRSLRRRISPLLVTSSGVTSALSKIPRWR